MFRADRAFRLLIYLGTERLPRELGYGQVVSSHNRLTKISSSSAATRALVLARCRHRSRPVRHLHRRARGTPRWRHGRAWVLRAVPRFPDGLDRRLSASARLRHRHDPPASAIRVTNQRRAALTGVHGRDSVPDGSGQAPRDRLAYRFLEGVRDDEASARARRVVACGKSPFLDRGGVGGRALAAARRRGPLAYGS
jgi:hypothetical protein